MQLALSLLFCFGRGGYRGGAHFGRNRREVRSSSGTSVVFLQFDGTTDEIYEKLRNEPLLETKKKAVENCRKAGLAVTLVPTVVKGVNPDNIGAMTEYLLDNVDVVKGIYFQSVSYFGRTPEDGEGRVTMFDALTLWKNRRKFFIMMIFVPSPPVINCAVSTAPTLKPETASNAT